MFELFAIVTFIFVTGLYFIANRIKDASIMDIFWGIGFILNTILALVISYLDSGYIDIIKFVLLTLISIWGVRLTLHILHRHKGEDKRYVAWRNDWGANYWWRSYAQIFLLQGLLMLIILSPIIIFITTSFNNLFLNYNYVAIGVIIWLFGFAFETIGDNELAKFIANSENKGKLLTSGLWKYTRHPNYFGEAVQWWGIFVIVICSQPLVAPWYILIIGPATITVLLRFVSGVPMTEKGMAKNPEFANYASRTNIFFPWFSKK